MRVQDFFKLTRPVQERFLAAARGVGAPVPLLAIPARRALPVGWVLLGLLFGGGLVVVMGIGFGKLNSSLALAGPSLIGGYACCVAVIALAALRATAVSQSRAGLPFRAGLYLFPAGVIDARSHRLRVHPLTTLKEVVAPPGGALVRLSFAGGAVFAFPVPSREHAAPARQAVLDAQQRLQEAEAASNEHDLAALDPLRDSGVPSPLMPTEPLRRQVAAWIRFTIPLALVIGGSVGAGLWFVRNTLSERRLFAAAQAENTVGAYRAYLAAGGHRSDVSDLLLPRAELAEARSFGNVAAIQKFIDEHPETHIQAEVHAALREALLGELEAARQQGTVTALRQLAQDSPYVGLIQAELQTAISAAFERAFSKFQAEAVPDNSEVEVFFKRLLAHAEQHGPKVEVRFRRLPTKGLEEADERVRTNPYYTGVANLPSQYFEDAAVRTREQQMGAQIVQRLQAAFPEDVLSFTLGSPLPSGGEDALPKVALPTLFLEHRAALSGAYLSVKPKAIFVGAGLTLRATFKIPATKKQLELKYSAWRPPDINAVYRDQLTHQQVYEQMAGNAFEYFQKKLLGAIFKTP